MTVQESLGGPVLIIRRRGGDAASSRFPSTRAGKRTFNDHLKK